MRKVNLVNLIKWSKRIGSGILTILFCLTLFLTISSKISGGTPKFFGYEMMNVLSGSMEPAIHTGSVIFLKTGASVDGLKVGDVITFKTIDNPNIVITHRIAELKQAQNGVQFVTKGDANDAKDLAPIPASNVLGKYAGVTVPFLGYVFTYIKSKAGIITFMIIPGALLIIWQLISIWRLLSKADDVKEKPIATAEEMQV
jgi:signal peptidase